MTQLKLAVETRSTARHISFLETGRSRPSAEMVARLAQALGASSRVHQTMLKAAGLPSLVKASPESAASEALTFAAESMALAHGPQPAFVFDGFWTVVFSNPAGCALLAGEQNLFRALFTERSKQLFANWEAVAWVAFRRLRKAADDIDDGRLDELLQLAADSLVESTEPDSVIDEHSVSPIFVLGDTEVPTVSVVAQFGSLPATGSLQVELIYATTSAGREHFRQQFGTPESARSATGAHLLDITSEPTNS